MRIVMEHVECGVCGLGTGLVDNDVPDEDTDTRLPSGWVIATFKRVVDNPEYKPPQSSDALLAEMLTSVPEEERAALTPALRSITEHVAAALPEGELHMVDTEPEVILCPSCVSRAFTLDTDAFVDAGWMPEPVDAEPHPEPPVVDLGGAP